MVPQFQPYFVLYLLLFGVDILGTLIFTRDKRFGAKWDLKRRSVLRILPSNGGKLKYCRSFQDERLVCDTSHIIFAFRTRWLVSQNQASSNIFFSMASPPGSGIYIAMLPKKRNFFLERIDLTMSINKGDIGGPPKMLFLR